MTLRAAAEQALKPCPFCGSEPYSCRHLSYSNWGVTCLCGATGPTKNAGYRPLREAEIRAHNDAVAAWNERAALAAEQPQPEAQPVACHRCHGTGVEDRILHMGDDGCGEFEDIRCSACDGFGRVDTTPPTGGPR